MAHGILRLGQVGHRMSCKQRLYVTWLTRLTRTRTVWSGRTT